MKNIFKILTLLTNLTKEKKKEAKKKRKFTTATVTFYFESTGFLITILSCKMNKDFID